AIRMSSRDTVTHPARSQASAMRDAASSKRLTTFFGGFSVTFVSTAWSRVCTRPDRLCWRPSNGSRPCSVPNAGKEVEHRLVERLRRLEVEAVAAARNLHQRRVRNVAGAQVRAGGRDQSGRGAGDEGGRGGGLVGRGGRLVGPGRGPLPRDC